MNIWIRRKVSGDQICHSFLWSWQRWTGKNITDPISILRGECKAEVRSKARRVHFSLARIEENATPTRPAGEGEHPEGWAFDRKAIPALGTKPDYPKNAWVSVRFGANLRFWSNSMAKQSPKLIFLKLPELQRATGAVTLTRLTVSDYKDNGKQATSSCNNDLLNWPMPRVASTEYFQEKR